jgi:hypothetical protein
MHNSFVIKSCNIFEKLRGRVEGKELLLNNKTVGYYTGSIQNNIPYGWGELFIYNNTYHSNTRLIGVFSSGLSFNGKIIIQKPNKLITDPINKKPDLEDKLLKIENWTNLIYQGEFIRFNRDGEPTGKGKLNFIKRKSLAGFKYDGEFVEGKMHGSGVLERKDGTVFDGIWIAGVFGKGFIRFVNDDIYQGEWEYGLFHGQGTFITKNEEYNGKWGKGCFISGRKTDSFGVIYEGVWNKEGKINEGEITFLNGDFYKGEIQNLKMHGQGVLFQKNGVVLEGIWFEGRYVQGRKNDVDGTIKDGTWIRKFESVNKFSMTNFVVIDLGKLVKQRDDLFRVINYFKSVGVPIPTSNEATPFFVGNESYVGILWFMINEKNISKIWINPDNGFIIAYEDDKSHAFSEYFIEHLVNLEPLEIPEDLFISDFDELDVDSILDKISKYGIKSLTDREKKILGK